MAAVSVAGAVLLAGCSSSGDADATAAAPTATSSASPGGGALPSDHVHAVAWDPSGDDLLLAAHDGLHRYPGGKGPAVKVGPEIDLMGFTAAGPDRYYASGHPGPGSDLPQPLGLVESTDGGATWQPRSLQGRSDFHALAAVGTAVVGYDGTLRTSEDQDTWRDLAPPVEPFALGGSPGGPVLLATSPDGLVRSPDAGASWAPVGGAPLLQVVSVAGPDLAAGVDPDGQVWVSEDGGLTWSSRAGTQGPPQAVAVRRGQDGAAQVAVVEAERLLVSTDAGASFEAL